MPQVVKSDILVAKQLLTIPVNTLAYLYMDFDHSTFLFPTDQLLLTFPAYSKVPREFCGFSKAPGISKITHFKLNFSNDLLDVFNKLVNLTELISQIIISARTDMTIFDTCKQSQIR